MKEWTPEAIRELVRQAVHEALAELPSPSLPPTPDLPREAPLEPPPSRSAPPAYYAPWSGVAYLAHPSQQLLPTVAAGTSEPLWASPSGFPSGGDCFLEKGQPCDDCGRCRSLGF
ncbi:MAG: hypothetical protein ACOYNR_08935 [Blastocatellia bacterium]|jgi:hypothetical protein